MSSNKIFIEKASRGASNSSLNDLWGAVSKSSSEPFGRKINYLITVWNFSDLYIFSFLIGLRQILKSRFFCLSSDASIVSLFVSTVEKKKKIAGHKVNIRIGLRILWHIEAWLTVMIVSWDDKTTREETQHRQQKQQWVWAGQPISKYKILITKENKKKKTETTKKSLPRALRVNWIEIEGKDFLLFHRLTLSLEVKSQLLFDMKHCFWRP